MHINGHINTFLADDFHYCVGSSFRKGSVLTSGIGSVQVSDVLVSQILS